MLFLRRCSSNHSWAILSISLAIFFRVFSCLPQSSHLKKGTAKLRHCNQLNQIKEFSQHSPATLRLTSIWCTENATSLYATILRIRFKSQVSKPLFHLYRNKPYLFFFPAHYLYSSFMDVPNPKHKDWSIFVGHVSEDYVGKMITPCLIGSFRFCFCCYQLFYPPW